MTQDEEIFALHHKLRTWHAEIAKRYQKELPWHLFKDVKEKLDGILKQANQCHRYSDLVKLKRVQEQTVFFVVPWSVLLWYAEKKKN